jgi:hypothetical protein
MYRTCPSKPGHWTRPIELLVGFRDKDDYKGDTGISSPFSPFVLFKSGHRQLLSSPQVLCPNNGLTSLPTTLRHSRFWSILDGRAFHLGKKQERKGLRSRNRDPKGTPRLWTSQILRVSIFHPHPLTDGQPISMHLMCALLHTILCGVT